jgi:hypothetical protein
VTLAVLQRVVLARLAKALSDPRMAAAYDLVAQATKFAADRASTRKSSITRQEKRHVIRLPDRDTKAYGEDSDAPARSHSARKMKMSTLLDSLAYVRNRSFGTPFLWVGNNAGKISANIC